MYLRIKIVVLSICFSCYLVGQSEVDIYQTPESVTEAFLDFISFEKGEIKDWEKCRNLFLPTAQMISINPKAPPTRQIRVNNLEQFVRNSGPQYSKNGFEEIVIGLKVDRFKDIANVFQSFYCKTPDGSYKARGINSYQLVYTMDRWWISSLMFTNESEDSPLTDEFLYERYRGD